MKMEEILGCELVNSCRLCLKNDGIMLPIFEGAGIQRDIAYKISTCFSHLIYEADPLPKSICHKCVFKLESFYQFRIEYLKAFALLKNCLIEKRTEPVVNDYLKEIEQENSKDTIYRCYTIESSDNVSLSSNAEAPPECEGYGLDTFNDNFEVMKQPLPDESSIMNLVTDDDEYIPDEHSDSMSEDSSQEGSRTFKKEQGKNTSEFCNAALLPSKLHTVENQHISGASDRLFESKMERSEHDLLVKSSAMNVKSDGWCIFCQKFLRYKNFKGHMVRFHSDVSGRIYHCKCRMTFESLSDLLVHNQSHFRVNLSVKEDDLYKCDFCDKKFADRLLLGVHTITHDRKYGGIMMPTSTFDVDKNKFTHRKERVTIKTENEVYFHCRHCKKTFESQNLLTKHLKCEHSSLLYICFLCGSIHQTVKCLNNHVLSHGLAESKTAVSAKYTTSSSKQQKSNNSGKALHDFFSKKISSGKANVRIYQCKQCKKLYSSSYSLERHRKTHTS